MGRPVRRGDSQQQSGHKLPKSPVTDWSFQTPAAQLPGGGSASFRHGRLTPAIRSSFRALSTGFFSEEAKRESRLEGAVFAVIAALAAWPMVLAAQAAATLLR